MCFVVISFLDVNFINLEESVRRWYEADIANIAETIISVHSIICFCYHIIVNFGWEKADVVIKTNVILTAVHLFMTVYLTL